MFFDKLSNIIYFIFDYNPAISLLIMFNYFNPAIISELFWDLFYIILSFYFYFVFWKLC